MSTSFTCDHIRFYHKGVVFSAYGAFETIALDASLTSSLDWAEAHKKAQQIIEQGKVIVWHLDFKLASISLDSPLALSSFLVALQTFSEQFYIPYASETLGVCLYDGPLLQEKNELEKSIEVVKELSTYLHRLAAALPDETLPFVWFDPPEVENAELAQLLSREHFPYLFVRVKEHPLPIGPLGKGEEEATLGVTFPLHSHVSLDCLSFLNKSLFLLIEKNLSYRILYESHLNESWDGLDQLVVFSPAVSPQGKRKLQGFAAAGGEVLTEGPKLEIPGEKSWEEFRGRGI